MKSNLTPGQISMAFQGALELGMIRDKDTAVICYDMDFLEERIRHLISLFPASALHGLAIKANPLIPILGFTRQLGTGVEAASLGEVNLALTTGYRPDQIVYDSPVKTMAELKFALKKGIHVNIDNLSELERVKYLLNTIRSASTIGLRINPQIGVGSILESSVAGEYSKFGIPIRYRRKELLAAFLENPWLTGVHLHVGSQGCARELLVEGIGVLYAFVVEVNSLMKAGSREPVSIFDIGGGLPISYRHEDEAPSMEEYVREIRKRAPGLFGDKSAEELSHKVTASPRHGGDDLATDFRIITEFGRWAYTNSGWTVSRVEYVKRDPRINTAMIHVGADLFLRECLNPKDWHHEFTVLDRYGNMKTGQDENPCNLAGPLCFSGDILAKNIILPRVEEGDYLIIHDSGGYTFSMWSRYNSRQAPRILGYFAGGKRFEVFKERETLEEVGRFWR